MANRPTDTEKKEYKKTGERENEKRKSNEM